LSGSRKSDRKKNFIGGLEKMGQVTWKEILPETNFWQPKETDDSLIGQVVEQKLGNYGKQYLIKESDGKTLWTPSHKVLQDRLESAKVGIGDKVKIVFVGKSPSKDAAKNDTSLYKVYVGK
jgi:hypothetical protein